VANLEALIAQVADPDLRAAIAAGVRDLKRETRFGLVFEEHAEAEVGAEGPGGPGLRPLAEVDRAPAGRAAHTLIEGENLAALRLLGATHEGAVDCIYIDPPYNTGARDWTYANDYVDRDDAYRHSKWLSFISRRLRLAGRLLKPDGVLVVTIDENEQARLGLLLEQLFPAHDRTLVTIVHNPRGIQGDNFSYCHEFAYFVVPRGLKRIGRRVLEPAERRPTNFRVWGGESTRATGRRSFYPLRFRDGAYTGAGDVPPTDFHPPAAAVTRPDGTLEVWPIDGRGVERKWRYARETVEGVAHLLRLKPGRSGPQVQITKETGPFKTVWVDPRFDAGTHGTRLLNRIVDAPFSFPKSLYAVLECLQAAVGDRPDATVLDFFAGSGTTLHATMLLNARDGGARRGLLVTNNEVDEKTARRLARAGHAPGDPAWEAAGVCQAVTWPRIRNAVAGAKPDGTPLPGRYACGRPLAEGFAERVERYRLEARDPDAAARGEAPEPLRPAQAPRAGS